MLDTWACLSAFLESGKYAAHSIKMPSIQCARSLALDDMVLVFRPILNAGRGVRNWKIYEINIQFDSPLCMRDHSRWRHSTHTHRVGKSLEQISLTAIPFVDFIYNFVI